MYAKYPESSFISFKSPRRSRIYPVMLQQKGLETILQTLYGIPRAIWRMVRAIFIPKPEKIEQDAAKVLRPISSISFILKTLYLRLLDNHISDVALANRPLHQDHYVYRAGMSTHTVQVTEKKQNILTRTKKYCFYGD